MCMEPTAKCMFMCAHVGVLVWACEKYIQRRPNGGETISANVF